MQKLESSKLNFLRIACFFIFNYAVSIPLTNFMMSWLWGDAFFFSVIVMIQLAFSPLLLLLFFICRRIQSLTARVFFILAWTLSTANFLEFFAIFLYQPHNLSGAVGFDLLGNMTLLLPIWLILAVIELALVALFIPQFKSNRPIKYYGFIPCFLVSAGVLFFTYLIADTSMKIDAIFIFIIAAFAAVMIFSTQKIHHSSTKHKFLFDYISLSAITTVFACVVPPHAGFSFKALIDNIGGVLMIPLVLSPFLVLMAVVHYKLIGKK